MFKFLCFSVKFLTWSSCILRKKNVRKNICHVEHATKEYYIKAVTVLIFQKAPPAEIQEKFSIYVIFFFFKKSCRLFVLKYETKVTNNHTVTTLNILCMQSSLLNRCFQHLSQLLALHFQNSWLQEDEKLLVHRVGHCR